MKKHFSKIVLLLILFLAVVLRCYSLSSNPPSLYWEEAALGYDAFSILKTGKDFHGHSWPLVAFESFGDYKPSLYFYTTVPSLAVFGLNPFAVRFPSALFGSLTVLLIFFIAQHFFSSQLALVAAFFLAISPWHLQLSRAGFEANLGLFFVTLGFWLFLKALTKPKLLFLSVLSLVPSLYAYHANRVFVPLLGLTLGLFYFKKLFKQGNKRLVVLTVILFFLLITPLALKLNQPQIQQRFNQTSAFSSLDPILKSNQLIEADDYSLWARVVHHRYWHYLNIFFDHYLDHFQANFLFLSGDTNPRHSTQTVGSFYLIQLPLMLWGAILAFKQKKLTPLFILMFLAPIPAALTKATPHALRSLPLIIPLTIFSAYGLTKLKKPLLILVSLVLLFESSRYLYIYHLDYPGQYSSHWQYGYQSMIDYLQQHQDQYDQIFITRRLGRPSIYYWFYTQTDPQLVQAADSQVSKDQGEYLQFQNIIFNLPSGPVPSHSLFVLGSEDPPIDQAVLVKQIYDLSGQLVFSFYET